MLRPDFIPYRALLSDNGNPRLSTLFAFANAVGLKLTVEAAYFRR